MVINNLNMLDGTKKVTFSSIKSSIYKIGNKDRQYQVPKKQVSKLHIKMTTAGTNLPQR